ncbi:MAG: hypothetical protein M1429_03410 [Patescibacteria group bacterium]|nr:hypothetical protein [Patescibacteria group bacterium]
MKKEKKIRQPAKKYLGLIITTIILIVVISLVGLIYWKVERIVKSFSDSAKKASSQNTPLSD